MLHLFRFCHSHMKNFTEQFWPFGIHTHFEIFKYISTSEIQHRFSCFILCAIQHKSPPPQSLFLLSNQNLNTRIANARVPACMNVFRKGSTNERNQRSSHWAFQLHHDKRGLVVPMILERKVLFVDIWTRVVFNRS